MIATIAHLNDDIYQKFEKWAYKDIVKKVLKLIDCDTKKKKAKTARRYTLNS